MKIRPVEVELFRANGRMNEQTNMTMLIVAVRNFANAPHEWREQHNPKAGQTIDISPAENAVKTNYKYSINLYTVVEMNDTWECAKIVDVILIWIDIWQTELAREFLYIF